MKEKMTPHIIAVMALVVFIVLGLACATTKLSMDKLEQGKYFALTEDYKEFFDSSKPIEEHCYIIYNLFDNYKIKINEKNCKIKLSQIIVLPKGEYNIHLSYYYSRSEKVTVDPNTYIAHQEIITTTTEAENSKNFTFEAGHYYLLRSYAYEPDIIDLVLEEQKYNKEDIHIEDNGKGSYVGTFNDSDIIPAKSLINGINNALKEVFPNFTGNVK